MLEERGRERERQRERKKKNADSRQLVMLIETPIKIVMGTLEA